MDVVFNGDRMEQDDCFEYSGADVHERGRTAKEINLRVREWERV